MLYVVKLILAFYEAKVCFSINVFEPFENLDKLIILIDILCRTRRNRKASSALKNVPVFGFVCGVQTINC